MNNIIKEGYRLGNFDSACADNVRIGSLDISLYYDDDGAYPFAWFNDKCYVGDECSMHKSPTEKYIQDIAREDLEKYGFNAECDGEFVIDDEEYKLGEYEGEGDGYEVDHITYDISDDEQEIRLEISYQDGTESDVEWIPYTEERIYKYLEGNGVHENIISDIVNKIINREYSDTIYGGRYWLDIDEEIESDDITPYLEAEYIPSQEELQGGLEMMSDAGRFWRYDKIICFWGTIGSNELQSCLDDLSEQTGFDFSDYRIVYYGDEDESASSIKCVSVEEYIHGNQEHVDDTAHKDGEINHLGRPQDKWEQTKDFRKNRGELQGKKLGNMTMAQYNALKHPYGESIRRVNKIVSENINKFLTEARDDVFSFNRLRILPYEKRLQYCQEHLGDAIGGGSSRLVFQLDDEWVLKLAKNKAGAAQNKLEIPDNYQNKLSIFVHVDEQRSDLEDYYWIVSEYVLPLEDGDVEECTNGLMDFEYLCRFILQSASQYDEWAEERMENKLDSIRYYEDDDSIDDDQDTFWTWDEFEEFTEQSETLRDINDYLTNYQFDGIGDWLRGENIGMALRNGKPRIVFLDSGFNRDIGHKYYGMFGDVGSWDDENEDGRFNLDISIRDIYLKELGKEDNPIYRYQYNLCEKVLDWAINEYGENYLRREYLDFYELLKAYQDAEKGTDERSPIKLLNTESIKRIDRIITESINRFLNEAFNWDDEWEKDSDKVKIPTTQKKREWFEHEKTPQEKIMDMVRAEKNKIGVNSPYNYKLSGFDTGSTHPFMHVSRISKKDGTSYEKFLGPDGKVIRRGKSPASSAWLKRHGKI